MRADSATAIKLFEVDDAAHEKCTGAVAVPAAAAAGNVVVQGPDVHVNRENPNQTDHENGDRYAVEAKLH